MTDHIEYEWFVDVRVDPKTGEATIHSKGISEEALNAVQLEVDELVYGIAIVDENGKRVDPREVSL